MLTFAIQLRFDIFQLGRRIRRFLEKFFMLFASFIRIPFSTVSRHRQISMISVWVIVFIAVRIESSS